MSWKTNWQEFVKSVAIDFCSGMSNEDVTAKYAGHQVVWHGTIDEKTLRNEFPSVQMAMPKVEFGINGGAVLTVDFLCLIVSQADRATWECVPCGTEIGFSTRLTFGNAPFSGIEWSEFRGEASILIGTENSKVVSVDSRCT